MTATKLRHPLGSGSEERGATEDWRSRTCVGNAASERCGCKARAAGLRAKRYTQGGTANLVQQCRIGTNIRISICTSISRTAIAGERADGAKMNVRWQNEQARSCRLAGLVLGECWCIQDRDQEPRVASCWVLCCRNGSAAYIHAEKYSSLYYSAYVAQNETSRRTI